MRRMMIATSLLLAMSTTAMAGQIYKWVDAQGVTHFGAQPPQGQQATLINTSTPSPRPSLAEETDEQAAPDLETGDDPEQAAIDEKTRQEVAAQAAERKQYCETVRTNLSQLQNNPRVRTEVDGEIRKLSEDERQQRIAELQKSIAENCR
ncbi:DUF4124 domain-containing protein [Pseudomonas xionganensis]|uniref:DUF4124 domain-containing protein n=1 Tax=Pseudomonas xionganensis TaxID=2654845 RepID=A0A6I4L3V1_9PSED|nr:DUF4124 domain-containing protein [Pseudomonas xionganensis]MVW76613.1 DUF4124 domain-containing protein [Pseudomonas xionganensis]